MNPYRPILGLLAGVTLMFAMPNKAPTEPLESLTEADFKRLHQELRPAEDECYLTIPWKINLLDAQRVAAQERKPIFIWAMDGHPLGCT